MQNDILTVSQAHLSTCNIVHKRLAKTIIRAHPNKRGVLRDARECHVKVTQLHRRDVQTFDSVEPRSELKACFVCRWAGSAHTSTGIVLIASSMTAGPTDPAHVFAAVSNKMHVNACTFARFRTYSSTRGKSLAVDVFVFTF